MTSRPSDSRPASGAAGVATPPIAQAMKIVIAGGFGAGKTTFVTTISEITPLTTEAPMTSLALGVDDLRGIEEKTTTTVAMDFGRITVSSSTILYLFGTPGQDRFWYMWDELSRGAVGAVVLVDTRRLPDCFAAIDYFEKQKTPYLVALNCFDAMLAHDPGVVRNALSVASHVPIVPVDARDRSSTKKALVALVEHAIHRRRAG